LFSLEAAAQSYRKLYDNFLQRQTETVQQQSWPISDARPVSPAIATKTYPRPAMVWTMAMFLGGVLGVGIAGLREITDRGFRTGEQVRSVLGTECLALVPSLTRRRRLLSNSRQNGFSGWQAVPALPARRADIAMSGSGRAEPRCIGLAPKIMHIIL